MWKKSHDKHAGKMRARNLRLAAKLEFLEMADRAQRDRRRQLEKMNAGRKPKPGKSIDWERLRELKRKAAGKEPFQEFTAR